MSVSAGNAVTPAFENMVRICFKPFDLKKWFVLGFAAFLSTCGEGGGGNLRCPGLDEDALRPVWNWITTHWELVIVLIAGTMLTGIVAFFFAAYIRCRGRFVFYDNIARNVAAIAEPWRRYRELAWSYFLFEVLMIVLSTVLVIVIVGLCLLIALPDFRRGALGPAGVVAIILGALLFLATMLPLGLVRAFAHDFVVPLMMVRNCRFRQAWSEARQTILPGHVGQLVLFYLLKIAFGMAAGILAVFACCGTCGLALLPYLSSVALLPYLVFSRMYGLVFLAGFRPDYALVWHEPPAGFPVIFESPPNPPSPPQA